MPPQAPWSPTAQAFAQHQFSHVVNFWKQGRPANFRLEALPGGRAELNLTFQLPSASEVVPPPFHPVPAYNRPIRPLFPGGISPQGPASGPKTKPSPQKKVSSKQRKSYQRSVLHRAALAVPSLPPPKDGSLRHAALACVQQLQGAAASPVSPQNANKRPFPDSPNAPSPSHLPPLAQRIRSDFQIGEREVESPERELLRSQLDPESFPPLNSPHCDVQGVPPPAPLVFTPQKPHERSEMPANTAEEVSAEKVAALEGSVVVCDEKKRNTEQIEEEEFEEESEEESEVEFEEEKKRRIEKLEKLERLMRIRDRFKDLEKKLEDGAISPEEYEVEVRKVNAEAEAEVGRKLQQEEEQQQEETQKCWNCEGEFSPDHQCYS